MILTLLSGYIIFYLAMDFDKRLKPAYTGLRKVIQKNTFLGLKIPIPPGHERKRILEHVGKERLKSIRLSSI